MNKHLIFVYGTLRQGGLRAMPDIFPAAKFIGQANVSGSLYDLGDYPGLLLDDANSSVIGEVYEIDDEIFHQLDEIEAASDYRRTQVEVSLGHDRMSCWVYAPAAKFFHQGVLDNLITSGDWIEYARTKTEMA